MQVTIDTAVDTPFQLNAAADFIRRLANGGSDSSSVAVEVHAPEHLTVTVTEGNAQAVAQSPAPAAGAPALPVDAGLVPAIPPAPGVTTAAAAPESTNPPAVPAAPTSVPAVPASPSAAAPAAGQVELDSAGCPWSPLIHTSNKATIGDGTWRKKPGVNPEYYESVRAELMSGNAPAADGATAQATTTANPTVSAGTATAPAIPEVPAPVLLTGNDVMARAMEVQMSDANKGAPLFQAITGAGIVGGPMGLPATTDQGLLKAALDAINAVAAQ